MWEDGLKHGRGKLTLGSGTEYVGYFADGVMHVSYYYDCTGKYISLFVLIKSHTFYDVRGRESFRTPMVIAIEDSLNIR